MQYINSDDYLFSNDVIEKCMNKLMETDADACIGNFRYRYRDDSIIDDYRENAAPVRREWFWRSLHYNHETLICKIDVYKKLGKHNLKYRTAIDYYWNIQLVLNSCSICTVNEIIFYGRAGGGTTNPACGITDEAVNNLINLWRDTWSFYPMTDDEYKRMMSFTYPLGFLKALLKYINGLNLKNFDYVYFNNSINTAINNYCKTKIIKNDLTRTILKILSIGDRYENKSERLKNHLETHPKHFEFLKKILLLLKGDKLWINIPWQRD